MSNGKELLLYSQYRNAPSFYQQLSTIPRPSSSCAHPRARLLASCSSCPKGSRRPKVMEKENAEEAQTTRALLQDKRPVVGFIGSDHIDDDGQIRPSDSSITALLILSTLVAVSGSFTFGFSVAYSSPVESEMMADLDLSTVEYSVFASLLTAGGALGAIMCGKTSDYLGRRFTMGLSDLFYILGWLAIAVSQGAWSLYLGRLFLGFSIGLVSYVVPVYIAEITTKDLRGGFVTLHMLMVCTGIAAAYLLGIIISWRVLALSGAIPSLFQLIGLCFIPQSPRWLLKIGLDKEFEAVLQRLRGEGADISIEAADIREYTEVIAKIADINVLQLFQKRYAYALTVGIGLFVLSQLSGVNGIIYYASSIFESAGLSGTVGTVVLAVIQIPTLIMAVFFMDKFGRRPLLMVSAGGLSLGSMLAGLSYILQDYEWLTGFSPYLVLIGIVVFSITYSFGLGGIIYLMIAEIYPMNVKGLAGSVANLAGFLASGLVTYTFNFSMEWSSAGTFFILAGVNAFTLLFVATLVPETKGRTLEEIQTSLNHIWQ